MLNLAFEQKLAIDTEQMPWESSPAQGVWRKKLEREAAESGHVTSIVKYAANSHFNAHTHPNGEEILVLEGTFSDEQGDYPTGSYLRNPAQSRHQPYSKDGCTLLVKLNQFQQGDTNQLAINSHQLSWQPGLVEGLLAKPLHSYGTEHVALVKWQPNTYFKPHVHAGGEEIYVIDGIFEDEFGSYSAGSWLRSPAYSKHTPYSKTGCTIWVKTGHLPPR
ncbi:cupin domain-containing protein [Colwellia sp. MEBiC06753]